TIALPKPPTLDALTHTIYSSSMPPPCPTDSTFFLLIYTEPTGIYTLSLHDALPICRSSDRPRAGAPRGSARARAAARRGTRLRRSEEHTSELQSQSNLVCRLLLEKKKEKLLRNEVIDVNILPVLDRGEHFSRLMAGL